MNQRILNAGELYDFRKRMQELESRMTTASSRVNALGHEVRISLRCGDAGLVLLLLVVALTSLAKGGTYESFPSTPEKWDQVIGTFQVLDDQENVILRIPADGLGALLELYPPGISRSYYDAAASVLASIPEGGHAFFKAQMPTNAKNVNAALGVVDGRDPGLVLRYGGDPPTRLEMLVENAKPFLNLRDAAGTVVASLGEGESRGGRLMLINGKGETIMQTGTTATGVGTVAVFPQGRGAFLPTAPIAGGAFALKEANRLPGTFICGVGCAGH